MHTPIDDWFTREILAHEAALMRFLRRNWRVRDEIHDLRQETYVRVYDAACRADALPVSPKSFLFTTARNLMADRMRRERVVSIESRGELESLNVLIDEISPERQTSGREELRRLAHALDQLPPKCREVVWLRRVEEIPQKQVANRLGVSEKTVEKHVARAMRLLADSLFGTDVTDEQHQEAKDHTGVGPRREQQTD